MPVDMSRYPPNWSRISREIRFIRDKGICQQCGLRHGDIIARSSIDASRWMRYDEHIDTYYDMNANSIRLSEIPAEFADAKYHRVVLTVHHIGAPMRDGSPGNPHDKMDCRDENLTSLCQRCHLIADLPTHMLHAKETRLRKRQEALDAAGQQPMYAENSPLEAVKQKGNG